MKRIAPGVYVDDRGCLHIFVGEMLRAAGYADTPHNRDVLTEEACRIFREKYPDSPLTVD
jgi:hypothetical protein